MCLYFSIAVKYSKMHPSDWAYEHMLGRNPGRFSLGRFALVFGVGRFALIRLVVSPVSRFARESFRPGSFRPNIL